MDSNKDFYLLDEMKKLIRISQRIKLKQAAEVLGLMEIQLIKKLMVWGEKLSIKLDGDMIIVDNWTDFSTEIDNMFAGWKENEEGKIGKLEASVSNSSANYDRGELNRVNEVAVHVLPVDGKRTAPVVNVSNNSKLQLSTGQQGIFAPPDPTPKPVLEINRKQTDFTQPTSFYQGFKLSKAEVIALRDLEMVADRPIPFKESIDWDRFGFLINKGHVVKLGLYRAAGKKSLKEIPESIGNLRYLEVIRAEYNDRLEKLPNTIGNLVNLKMLDFGSCDLSKLPESIGNLKNLNYLYLSNNNLSELPITIGNLHQLIEIDLRGNELKTLPESIINLENLVSLNLRGNKLEIISNTVRDWLQYLKNKGCKISG
ncbi:MAG: leucine-rich repeat domain-containing protein, partial [Promethearchaeota archaeon]